MCSKPNGQHNEFRKILTDPVLASLGLRTVAWDVLLRRHRANFTNHSRMPEWTVAQCRAEVFACEDSQYGKMDG